MFTSPFARASETAARIAEDGGPSPLPRDPMAAQALVGELLALPAGSVAVVVGHSNTLPLIASAFGRSMSGLVEERGQLALPRDEHDRLFELRLASDASEGDRVLDLRESRVGCDPGERSATP